MDASGRRTLANLGPSKQDDNLPVLEKPSPYAKPYNPPPEPLPLSRPSLTADERAIGTGREGIGEGPDLEEDRQARRLSSRVKKCWRYIAPCNAAPLAHKTRAIECSVNIYADAHRLAGLNDPHCYFQQASHLSAALWLRTGSYPIQHVDNTSCQHTPTKGDVFCVVAPYIGDVHKTRLKP